jgi:predicted N-formylglutamate amidohydrolase
VRDFLVVTCEHGGNRIPSEYAGLFRGWRRVLSTHRGFDAGALVVARDLGAALAAPVVASTTSRLLIDLNRSLSNRNAWSDATRGLPTAVRDRIVRRHYAPHREQVEAIVAGAVADGHRAIHVASHSFTPILDGRVRTADVGLLYDPARAAEAALAARWKDAFADVAPGLRVRRNYPYAGKNDGLTSSLRRRFSAARYVGMEIEVNQAYVIARGLPWRRVRAAIVATLRSAIGR